MGCSHRQLCASRVRLMLRAGSTVTSAPIMPRRGDGKLRLTPTCLPAASTMPGHAERGQETSSTSSPWPLQTVKRTPGSSVDRRARGQSCCTRKLTWRNGGPSMDGSSSPRGSLLFRQARRRSPVGPPAGRPLRIVVPLPFALRTANAWLFPGAGADPPALVDSGIGTPEGQAALLDGLGAAGVDTAGLRLFVTHGHIDHPRHPAAL